MLINFFLQKCGAYLRAEFNTIVISLITVFTRISAAALINFHPSLPPSPMRRLFEGGGYSSNYCNWQPGSLLQIVSTFRTLLHLGQNVVTFRTLLPGPSRRLAPVIKCSAFLCFQSYIVRDILLTEIYRWLVTFGSVR